MPTELQEIGGRLGTKRAEWKTFLDTNGNGEFDFAKADDRARFEEKNTAIANEVAALHDQYMIRKRVEDARESNDRAIAEQKQPTRGVPPAGVAPGGPSPDQWAQWMADHGTMPEKKSIGRLFCDKLAEVQAKGQNPKAHAEFALDDVELKTTLSEAAGLAPANFRMPMVVPFALRRPVVADLIPQVPTDQRSAVVYMEETTNTNNAAPVAEGATKPESAFLFTQRTVNIEVIAVTLPVTEQQLDDVPMLMAMINQRLGFHIQLAEEAQILTGNGTSPQLMGFLNKTGVLTQARGTDPDETAFFNAITQVRTTGFAEPDGGVIHPTNWSTIVTHQTTIGSYVWANGMSMGPGSGGQGLGMNITPSVSNFNNRVAGAADLGNNRLWGIPMVVTPAITVGTGLVGAFQEFSMLVRRMGLNFVTGWANDDLLRNIRRIRAEERIALVISRPAAFSAVTGLN